ncbi:hypothetical protein C8T65DRAFT_670 [Cerioporus squamosus]|nr:hypothetical protein C8T65DRAFT_670 [Cerioporus squamosus]
MPSGPSNGVVTACRRRVQVSWQHSSIRPCVAALHLLKDELYCQPLPPSLPSGMGQLCCKSRAMEDAPENRVEEPKPICHISTSTLDTGDHPLDMSSTASPCHIRLVDCHALTTADTLRIVESPDFPTAQYSAISYPWRGVVVDPSSSGRTFAVRGAEHADPVGIDALRHACTASLLRGIPYLWLDRLCIMQDNREDKSWQIRHMYRVYKSCSLCIVLAGGVQRLVRLDEETSWIHRSWTLQEVLAPPEVVVLMDWKLGPGTSLSGGRSIPIQEVIPGESAIAPLPLVLEACTVGSLSFASASSDTSSALVEASIFSAHPSKHSHNDIPFWRPQRKILAPNVSALSIAMDPVLTADADTRAHAVWQSALMRTSSRPVDMVFSIMGLFDVTLDPAQFHKDDRRGATIALAQTILQRGGSASWLALGCRLEPDRSLSTFPTFPRTSVAGVAFVQRGQRVQEVSELVDPVYPVAEALVPFPKGSMDDAGYFTFTARAVPLRPVVPGETGRVLVALDGSRWAVRQPSDSGEIAQKEEVCADAYAVLVGWFNRYYPGQTSALDKDNIRVMLLEEHQAGMAHVRSYITLSQTDRAYVLGWSEREFHVGGPDEAALLSQPSQTGQELLPTSSLEEVWPRVPNSRPVKALEDEVIRKARWAVPQRVLERYRSRKEA